MAPQTLNTHERQLTMLWLDAFELVGYLQASGLTAEKYKALPLNRTSLCWLLAALVAKVESLEPGTHDELDLPAVWPAFVGLPDLSDERTPFSMSKLDIKRTWYAAAVATPALLQRLASHPAVRKGQAYMEALARRSPDAWPQPQEDAVAPTNLQARHDQLAQAAKNAMFALANPTAILRIWWLTTAREPTFVLDHTQAMTDSLARQLAQHLEAQTGQTPILISQLSLHPLLWDTSVARELLLWKSPTASTVTRLAPLALSDPLEHHDHVEHGGQNTNGKHGDTNARSHYDNNAPQGDFVR